jgi:hypothetical protein
MKATLLLTGSKRQLQEFVGLAVAEGVLEKYELVEQHLVEESPKPYSNRNTTDKNYKVGDRVKVIQFDGKYEVKLNTVGVVTKILSRGNRSSVMVRWDDNHESRIAGGNVRKVYQ